MRAINCPRCGRLFNKVLSSVCARCEKEEEQQFKVLREYIEDNPFANINEVADASGVPVKRILQYIKEGRIIASNGLDGELRCSQCGTPIDEGSFCQSCTVKMAQNLASGLSPNAKTPEAPQEERPKDNRRGVGFHTTRRR